MIAQVVLDLPIDGPFDYIIPEHLISRLTIGTRVKVSFGPKVHLGFVIGLVDQSTFPRLKSIQSLADTLPAFTSLDLFFAREFSAYYGCSLGESLATMLRNKTDHEPNTRRDKTPLLTLYQSPPHVYTSKIRQIIDDYKKDAHFLILVPDAFGAETLDQQLQPWMSGVSIKIGTRSAVFESNGRHDCVIMVDDEDSSYKQEQTPMYETAQVLLMRSQLYGFDVAFVGISPSVELMAMVAEKKVRVVEDPQSKIPSVRLVDLSNYKYIPGLISPPVRDALDGVLKAGKKGILVLNRRGSYRLTRCVDCGEVLKCKHCDSSLIYSRSEAIFLCRHCTFTAAGDTDCPKCHKPSWRSVGIGVEQVKKELEKQFPHVKIISYERSVAHTGLPRQRQGSEAAKQALPDFDILIATSAILRYQGSLQVQLAAFIDFDAEINRLDMRSAFNAFSLARHISGMALGEVFIQTRNIGHYVLQTLSQGKIKGYYDEELKLRKELGFSPFKHWIKVSWRGKTEKLTHQAAQKAFDILNETASKDFAVTPPLADTVTRKRNQFRFNVMVQTAQIPPAVAVIKSALAQIPRRGKVIVTLNVDP